MRRVESFFSEENRGVHTNSCIMGNQGRMAGKSKICIGIRKSAYSSSIHIFDAFSLKRVTYEFKETIH